jgi:hypothetical protein
LAVDTLVLAFFVQYNQTKNEKGQIHMDTRWSSHLKTKREGVITRLSAKALAADLPRWLSPTIVVVTILIVSSIYLWPSPREFPMDDTYIHFVYAENLSEHGGLFFNDPGEKGVGTSSLLWVLLLGAGNWAGLSMHWLAKSMGVASLAAVGIGLYALLRPLLSPYRALAVSLLVILSGHMLWFSLSGMETMLFLALGSWHCCVTARSAGHGWELSWAAGHHPPGGIILALVIAGFEIWRHRAIRSGLLVAGAVTGLICFPWILYLWQRTGHFLPTSGIGRHYSNITAIQRIAEHSGSLAWISQFLCWLIL